MIRPASTICLLRPGGSGLEVLLVLRAASSSFMAGAFVFPGGVVEEADRGDAARRAVRGAPSEESRPWLAAALREAGEEAGVWLTVPEADQATRGLLQRQKGEALYRRLAELGLALDGSAPVCLSNWVTPAGPPRRFDTRFFVASLPSGTEAVPDEEEVVEACWVAPSEALVRLDEGSWRLMVPTVWHLELLSRFTSPEEVVRHARELHGVLRVEASLVRDERGDWRVRLPGEEGYARGFVPVIENGEG